MSVAAFKSLMPKGTKFGAFRYDDESEENELPFTGPHLGFASFSLGDPKTHRAAALSTCTLYMDAGWTTDPADGQKRIKAVAAVLGKPAKQWFTKRNADVRDGWTAIWKLGHRLEIWYAEAADGPTRRRPLLYIFENEEAVDVGSFIWLQQFLPKETSHYHIYSQTSIVMIVPWVNIDGDKNPRSELQRVWGQYYKYAGEAISWLRKKGANLKSIEIKFWMQEFWPAGQRIPYK